MTPVFEERPMSDVEYAQASAAFDEHGRSFGNLPETVERHGFVAVEEGSFVGASSGLAQISAGRYSPYFFLTDLLVVREQRGRGYGGGCSPCSKVASGR
jgi:hypothetical protein